MKSNQHSYTAMVPMNHNKDQHYRITLIVQYGTHILAVFNSSVIGHETAQQEGNHLWYWKPTQS